MQSRQGGLFSGPEPIFGVCEAIGRDFRINPMLVRLAFGVSLMVNLGVTLAVYAGLAVLVFVSRLVFPDVHGEFGDASSVAPSPTLPAPSAAEEREYAQAA